MNQDTNREDRVERTRIARLYELRIVHLDGSVETFYPKACLSCGASSDPYGNLPCPCGQPEYST
jgi:hypothetical protein